MHLRHLSLTVIFALTLNHSAPAFAAARTPRTCSVQNSSILGQEATQSGGIGGTGHETTNSPGGMGGTGHDANLPSDKISRISETGLESTIPPGGIGGTGHEPIIPPGGIGGTGIVAAGSLININGAATVEDYSKNKIQLAIGDEICLGDKITTNQESKVKILFTDGATLYILRNTELSIDDYHYSIQQSKPSRSLITLAKGDIRSVSGKISKINPKNYGFKTPLSTIHVIGTDFLISHLLQQEGAVDAGTYTKVISGQVSVQSSTSTIRLHAGESSHVMLNGTQSVISSEGGTCTAP